MVKLYDRLNDFLVEVNNYPYHRTEIVDKKRGVVRTYGKDGNKEKINSVRYSKKHYSEDYIRENILPQYENCPLCRIGQDIKEPRMKELSGNIKAPAMVISIIGLFSIPFLLYTARKRLTK